MLEVKITVDVVTEPVTLAEAKAFMVVDASYTADDTLITGMIVSARVLLEKYTNLSFAPKTLKCFTDQSYFYLPYGPITAVTEVIDGNETVIASDNYTLQGLDFKKIYIGAGGSGFFYPIGGGSPIHSNDSYKSTYTVTYEAGYTELHEGLKLAIKEQVNHMYNTRGETEQSREPKLCLAAKMLADPFSRRPLL